MDALNKIKMMNRKEFEEYLISIGGLKNGWSTYWDNEEITFNEDKDMIFSSYFFAVDEGWFELIKNLINELIIAGWNKEVKQVKEKFSTLRFYINEGSDEIHNIIFKYEKLSAEICEKCGDKGELRSINNWLRCLCEKCEKTI